MRIVINTDTKKIVRPDPEGTEVLFNFSTGRFQHATFFNRWLDILSQVHPVDTSDALVAQYVWHLAAPKSGSTWLTVILTDLLGWKVCPLISLYDRREQEIELTNLLYAAMHKPCFFPHQHCRYSRSTEQVILRMGIRPVLQYRNIFDTVISFYDHCSQGELSFPMAYMDGGNWNALDNQQRLNFIIDLMVPWYFNFYAGWFSSDLMKNGTILPVAYEDLLADPAFQVRKILDWIGVKRTDMEIHASLERSGERKTRKNIGVNGRGSQLNCEQKERIQALARYYPTVDFGRLGL